MSTRAIVQLLKLSSHPGLLNTVPAGAVSFLFKYEGSPFLSKYRPYFKIARLNAKIFRYTDIHNEEAELYMYKVYIIQPLLFYEVIVHNKICGTVHRTH